MPRNWKQVGGKPFDEDAWKKAQELAKKEGRAGDYPYIVGIYKRIKGISKSLKLVIGKSQDLNDYRCPECNSLLLRGINLEKAIVEIKCKKCGIIVDN